MSETIVICPVCKHNQKVKKHRISQSMECYGCPVCGDYEMPAFLPDIHGESVPNRKLSAWIREQNERGESVRFAKKGAIENVLASIPDYRPLEKQLKLLQAIERKTGCPGEEATLSFDEDFPLAYANGSRELWFYVHALGDRGLIDVEAKQNAEVIDYMTGERRKVKITANGWDYLDKHACDLEEKTRAFVAMSFSAAMKPMYEKAIKQAIQNAGYTACLSGEDPHSDNIIFKIMAEIKSSRFVVADITEQRNGVYFEAGYALGLGLPVIWSVRKDDVENVHFDTAQYNQIRWESAEGLKEGLFDYICAIIGKRR